MKFLLISMQMFLALGVIFTQSDDSRLDSVLAQLVEEKDHLNEAIKPYRDSITRIDFLIDSLNEIKKTLRLEEIKASGTITQTSTKAKLRDGSNPAAKVLMVIPKGARVTAVECVGDYYRVSYKNMMGWLNELYLVMTDDLRSMAQVKVHSTPSTIYRSTGSTRSKSSSKCSARQCMGRTQKGVRCRNKTTNCSGRCHVHS